MVTKAFQKCHKVTAKWEGGWANHKDDPGGATMFGVTQAVYNSYRRKKNISKKTVRYITKDEALDIYYNNYWLKSKANNLAVGVDLAVYDAAVNSGVSRSRKWLLASLDKSDNHAQTVKNICKKRLGFVQSLRIWKTFGRGWARRIADIQAKGVAWSIDNIQNRTIIKHRLEVEAQTQNKKAIVKTKAGMGTGGASAATGGVTSVSSEQADMIAGWLLTSILVAGIIITGLLLWRAWLNKQQALAFEREAGEVQ